MAKKSKTSEQAEERLKRKDPDAAGKGIREECCGEDAEKGEEPESTCGADKSREAGQEAVSGEEQTEKPREGRTAEPEESGAAGPDESEAEEPQESAAEEPEAEDKAEEMTQKYMRLAAEFQNFKKRSQKEKDDMFDYATSELMARLLPVLDNFERALQSESQDEKFAEGMKMIFRQLTDVLEKAGLEEIEALGEDFDPNLHSAVMMEDNSDFDSGKVSGVMQKGYKLKDRVIRPSMVRVNN